MMEMDLVMAERPANIQAVCRLCLSEKTDSLKSIFDDALGPNRVPQKIQQLIQIQVNKNDKLSTMVCNDCIIRLDTWFSYKKQCHRNQAKLAEWMTKLVGQNILDVNLHIKSEPLDIDMPRHGVPIKVEVDYPLCTEMVEDEYDDFSAPQPSFPRDNNDHLYLEHLPMEVDDADDSVHGARCPICHKTFQNINNRRRHQNMAHRKDKRAQMAEIKKPEVEPSIAQDQTLPEQTAEQETVQSSDAGPDNNITEKPADDVGTTVEQTTINSGLDNTSSSMETAAIDSNKMTEKDENTSEEIKKTSAEANDSTAETKDAVAETNNGTAEMIDAEADKATKNEPNDSQHKSIPDENKEKPTKESIGDNSIENIEVSIDGQKNKEKINDKNEPSEEIQTAIKTTDEMQTAEKTTDENPDNQHNMAVEESDNQQKIEFAAGLKLVQKDATPSIEFESLSKIELSYIEKCKAMVSMFHTLQCACHNVQHKSLRYLLSHLREMRIWFPLFTCYSCMISFTDRSTFTKHHSKCPRGQLETLIKLSNIKKRSEIKPRLYQNYKCNRCKFLYSFHDDFCKHINEDHAAGSPPFYCSCRFVFDSLEEYKTHCYTSCVLSYYCDICFITTKTVEEFVKHCEETHDQSEGFVLLQDDSFTPRVNYTYRPKEANDESNVIEGKRERRRSAKETIMVQIYDSEIPPDPKDIPTRVLRKIVPMEHIPTNTAEWNKQPAKCPACDKEYSSVSNMIRHYRVHIERKEVEIPAQLNKSLNDDSDNEDLYSCPECGGVYPPSSWKNHIEENHPPVNCSECDKVFQFKSELNQHRSVHLNLKVYRDSKTHSYKTAAISPSAEENEIVGEIMVMCEICDAMFKNKEDLKHHKLTEHPSNISRASSSMDSLEMSREDSKSGLKSAIKTRNPDEDIADDPGNESFPCENCDKVYASTKTLKDHMMNRHGLEYLKKSEFPKKCDYCDKVCSTPAGLALHTQVHERVNPDRKSDFPKKCEYCDKICTTGAGLYLHTQMHERMTLGDLKKDKIIKKIVHENPDEESYHTCKRCFKVFATKGKLKDHMKSHGINPSKGGSKLAIKKNRKILCDLCHIAVDSNEALAKHKAEEHNEELDGMPTLTNEMEVDEAKPSVIYTCDICVETFDSKAELREHKETHMVPRTKSALIFCKYCKIAFVSVNELTKHMHEEHGESAKPKITKEKPVDSGKPFKCPTCFKGFGTHGAMTAHAGWHKRSSNALQAEKRSQQSPQETSAVKLVKKAKLLKKVTETALKKEEPIEPPPFQCTTCFLELPNETALQIHILEKHRHLDSLMLIPRCDTCNQDFMTQDEYDMHKRFHDLLARQKKHEQMQQSQQKIQTPIIQSVHSVSEPAQNSAKKFPCNWCASMFGRSDTLNTHVKQHHPEHVRTEFECPQCDRTFDKQSSLTIHLKVHDRQKNTAAVGNGVGGSGKIYSCSICSQCFNYPKDLRMHTINAHPF